MSSMLAIKWLRADGTPAHGGTGRWAWDAAWAAERQWQAGRLLDVLGAHELKVSA